MFEAWRLGEGTFGCILKDPSGRTPLCAVSMVSESAPLSLRRRWHRLRVLAVACDLVLRSSKFTTLSGVIRTNV